MDAMRSMGAQKLFKAAFIISLGVLTTIIARDYAAFGTDAETLKTAHLHLVRFEGGVPAQYRLLSFLVPEVLRKAGFEVFTAYSLVHFMVITMAFAVFFSALGRLSYIRHPIEPAMATVALAFVYVFGMEPVFQEADSWELLSTALLFSVLLKRRKFAVQLTLVLLLGVLTKESIFFFLPAILYKIVGQGKFALHTRLLRVVLILAPALLAAAAMRYYVGAEGALRKEFIASALILSSLVRDFTFLFQYGDPFRSASRSGNFHVFFLFAWLAPVYFAWSVKAMRGIHLWILLSLPIYIGMNLLFGYLTETRIFVSCFVFIIPLVIFFLRTWPSPARGNSWLEITAKILLIPIGAGLLWIISAYVLPPYGLYGTARDGNLEYRWFDRAAMITGPPSPGEGPFVLPYKLSGYIGPDAESAILNIVVCEDSTGAWETQVLAQEQWRLVELPPTTSSAVICVQSDFYFSPAAQLGVSPDRRLLSMQLGKVVAASAVSGLELDTPQTTLNVDSGQWRSVDPQHIECACGASED